MSYSPKLSSGLTFAKNRSAFISPQSGMCSFCTQDCNGTCELAQAAVLGAQTVYPTTTGNNQNCIWVKAFCCPESEIQHGSSG